MARKSKKALDALENPYAGGAIVNLGQIPRKVKKALTGRPSIDYVTDGGIPLGRMILIAGHESAGKSSLAIQLIECILNYWGEDARALYLDTEYTLTSDYLTELGTDSTRVDHAMPESTEQMYNIIRANVSKYKLILIDSINNSKSEEELGKAAEDLSMAKSARTSATQLPICLGMCAQHDTTLIILSQVRENMKATGPYSPKTVIPGGRSLHHNSSLTLEMKQATKKKSADSDELELYDTIGGHMTRITAKKNKVGDPHRTVEVEFEYGRGFTIEADIAAAALRLKIFTLAGSWVKYGGNTVVQGKDNLKYFLEDNPELTEKVLDEIERLTGGQSEEE